MKTYSQLSYEQRYPVERGRLCQISILNKMDFSQQMMAETIGVSQSTVSRELRRNTGQRGYREKQAQNLSDKRGQYARKPTKMTPGMVTLIALKREEKWSPEEPAPRSALGADFRLASKGKRPNHER